MEPMKSMKKWWPDHLGEPSSAGSQNEVRYAFFPDSHQLAVEQNGKMTLYDSGDHIIDGVGQQQGGGSSLTFSSQHGEVKVNELKRLG
jgi:hypothetical protein